MAISYLLQMFFIWGLRMRPKQSRSFAQAQVREEGVYCDQHGHGRPIKIGVSIARPCPYNVREMN
jgi:hypothetical protein